MADSKDLLDVLKNLNGVLQKNLKAIEAGIGQLPGEKNVKEVERDGLSEVYVQVIFLKVGEVNTIQEKFSADVFVQARWREPQLDSHNGSCGVDRELLDWKNYWNPKIYIENALGELKEDIWHQVKYYEGDAYICQKRRAKGTFFERMELMDYPFDTQDLTVTATTERGELEVSLTPDRIDIPSVNVQSFVDEQEWKLHKHIKSWTKVTTNVYKNTKHKHPALSLSCKVTRRAQYFFYNIILIMIFISSLVFSTFTVDQALVQNRLQLSFILLLSNITFKFTVSQTLPRVSYLTLMDKYIIGSMFQLCLVCAWHAVVSQIYDAEDTERQERALLADRIALAVLGGGYIAFNLTFLILSQVKLTRKMRKYQRKDAEHSEQMQKAAEEKQEAAPRPSALSGSRVKVEPADTGNAASSGDHKSRDKDPMV